MAERTAASELSASELPASLVRLLQASAPDARLVSARALGADEELVDSSHKGAGYGAPLLLELETSSGTARWVLHTATANPFGHDRRADRAAEMLLAYDTFGEIPRHARVIDVGAYRRGGGSHSLADSGEFYLLTEWLSGSPYAHDLRVIGERALQPGSESLTPSERRRAQNLARYLSALHSSKLTVANPETTYRRAVRDLIGSGEGLFGIRDGYPESTPAASPERLDAIERRVLEYRSKLRARTARLARIHGDFHPFNILFDDEDEPRLLDASRGCAGDPADDVVCLTVNYLFFGLLFEPA
ncbi:MAG TPA: aminoglycoside phosphotransferase family protein, partial [Polyangiaceae bacterium]|nr:aminoglycoside phosphotransferase family protein [Polyangiaceae bacterium]